MTSPLFERLRASGPEAADFLKSVRPIEVTRSPEPLPGWRVDENCWIWQGPPKVEQKSPQRAAHELFVGPVAAGHVVKARCANGLCVHPRHLETKTVSESYSEGSGKLTPTERDQVRNMLADGRSQADVARRFGITQPAVSALRRKDAEQIAHDRPAESLAEWLDRQSGRLGPVGKLARGEAMPDATREAALSKATREYMVYQNLVREYVARAKRQAGGQP